MENIIDKIGLVTAIILPFFNIPLIVRIIKRRSSHDISLTWALGVWICLIFMAPSGFKSKDVVWKTFNIVNLVLFTAVTAVTLKFHKGQSHGEHE